MKLNIILTCDGGSGHKSAAEALRMQAIDNNDHCKVINTTREGWFSGVNLGLPAEYDGFFHNGLIDLGPFATRWWDWAQRESQTELLRIFANLRKLSFLHAPSFRYKTYHLLKDIENIDDYDEVIFHNTQPNCVQALISAIAKYNREAKADNQKQTVRLINHFTDMPTLQAQMFIEEMAKIDVADLDDAQFELHTRPPILEEDDPNLSPVEIDLIYHQRIKQLYPKLYQDVPPQKKRVFFVDGPIRKEFVQRKENPAKRCDGLSIQFTDQSEFDVLNQALGHVLPEFNFETSHALMPLEEDAEIVSIMLGSQASIEGTLGLVQEEIKIAEGGSKTKCVFVFCGANKPSEGLILYQQVLDIAQKVNVDPQYNIRIIPLTNQPASTIADVYSLADRIITRPGGISIMEIEAVVKRGKIFIFTELGQLEKLFNQFLSRSNETLKELFSQQRSQQRFADLIAWEGGNALHARNMCKDEYGRTRVVPVNVYTFQRELEFSNEKDAVTKLLVDKSYSYAFDQLMTNRELNIFFLTGHGVGVDLALLVEVTQLYDQISKELEDLIQRNPELTALDNGPMATLALVHQARDYITDNLALPSAILKEVPSQIKNITDSLQNSIHVVKQSNIENKSAIVRTLEFISRAFLNFFRSILGLNLDLSPEADLKKLNRGIREVIKRPMMDKVKPDDIDDESNVDASQWEELDKIISMIPAEEKNKTFEIKQADYPQLKHNFLFCGSLEKDEPICFVIGKVLGQGGGGLVSFLKSRDGKPAVMKDHSAMKEQITIHEIEFDCLKKMGMLIKGMHYPSDSISVMKYVPGETLHNYVRERKLLGLFTIYKSFKEEKKIKLSLALVTALKNVLDNDIVHGDIAPQNILIQEDGYGQFSATIIDFGLSHMKQDPILDFKPYISPYYGPPELRQAHSLHNEGDAQVYPYSDKSDIYSLGIILKDLGVASSLIKRMTDDDPEKRPDINEVLDILNVLKAEYSLDAMDNKETINIDPNKKQCFS